MYVTIVFRTEQNRTKKKKKKKLIIRRPSLPTQIKV